VFRLAPGLPAVAGARLQQFDRSPQVVDANYGARGADFIEVALPWDQLGGRPSNGVVRVAAVAASVHTGPGVPMVSTTSVDTGFHGSGLEFAATDRVRLASWAFVLAEDPDPDGDGLPTAQELVWGTDPAQADTDGDGLPDGWEVAHGLNPKSAQGADGGAGDPDGDGVENWSEWLVGSDPRDAGSRFRVEVGAAGVGGIRLRWQRVEGRRYVVERAEGLPGGFVAVVEEPRVDGDAMIYEEPLGGAVGRYYRVRVMQSAD